MRDEMGNWDDLLVTLCPCVTCGRLVCFRWNMVSTWHVFPSETYFLSSKHLASLFIFDIFLKKWHSFLLWVWVRVASRNAFLLRSPARHRAGNRKSQQFAFFHQWGPRLSASATAPCGPFPRKDPLEGMQLPLVEHTWRRPACGNTPGICKPGTTFTATRDGCLQLCSDLFATAIPRQGPWLGFCSLWYQNPRLDHKHVTFHAYNLEEKKK